MSKTTKTLRFVKSAEVNALIASLNKGEIFSLFFERVAPKCLSCNKSNKKWKGLTHCPICGEPLSLERESMGQKGIENPADKADKPNGNGVSAELAEELWNVLKYYDMNAVSNNGVKGAYRSCRIDNIKRITFRHTDYYVIK